MITKTKDVKVLVFKSNISGEQNIEFLQSIMDEHTEIIRWNIDRHDIDNVLRIETTSLQPAEVEKLVSKAGFFCQELPD